MKQKKVRRLLIVGPLPPPSGGATISFYLFCEAIKSQADWEFSIIDTSPKQVKKRMQIISFSNFIQAWNVFWRFFRHTRKSDSVLIFGSNGFLVSMVPFLLIVAKLFRKPCYARSFGGSLDRFYDGLMPLIRKFFLLTLRNLNGLIVETKLLYDRFYILIGDKVHFVPGYREIPSGDDEFPHMQMSEAGRELRLVFLGLVREEKGIFVLLESLRQLDEDESQHIHCVVYGEILEKNAARFEKEISNTDSATYKGILTGNEVIATLQNFDALILPTYYQGEGHPGVLIEAMQAGIPVITTSFRAIPEIVINKGNGLLVPEQNVECLTEAIRAIYSDRKLLKSMGIENWKKRKLYDVQKLAPTILKIVYVDVNNTQ